MARWSVDLIRNRAQRLGTVVAKTEKEAIAVAIKQFDIEPVRRTRFRTARSRPRMQLAELDYIFNSRVAATTLAENYVGLPLRQGAFCWTDLPPAHLGWRRIAGLVVTRRREFVRSRRTRPLKPSSL